jgi:thiol-disulfide isomerase/thioredoxin
MKSFKLFIPLVFFVSMVVYVPEVKMDDINARMKNGGDTIYVVNYWATWCAPCVKELPEFEKLDSVYKNQKVKVILVSTDFRKDIETKLKPFIEKKQLHSEVNFLDEIYDNEWIPKVDSTWQGALPATKIYYAKTGKSVFIGGSTKFEVLDSLVKKK